MTRPDNGAADEIASDGQDGPASKLNAQAILELMGGISGLIYSSLPVLVFVPVSSFAGLMPAIYAALGVASLILVWRLIRRESLQTAVSGFFAVGVCAAGGFAAGACAATIGPADGASRLMIVSTATRALMRAQVEECCVRIWLVP